MVDELIAKLFDREVDRVLGPIPSEIRRTAEEFSVRGVLTSSMYIQAIFRLIVDGLREVVLKRVEIEKQVWNNQAKKPKEENGQALKEAITASVESVAPRFFGFVEEQCRRVRYQDLIPHMMQEFSASKTKFIADAHREIEIWIGLAAIEAEKPLVSPVHITYNLENYGIFQVGPQSQAIVVSGREHENQWIIEGLSQVREELAGLKELQAEQKSELIGAVETAIAEVNKGKPNPLTIGGIITAVGSATSVLANATKAYETIKLIAGRFGVTLP